MPAALGLDEAAILKALQTGARHADIAADFGCVRSRVSQIAVKYGHDSRAMRRAQKADAKPDVAPVEPTEPARIGRPPEADLVPPWAEEVADDYIDHLKAFDEFVAARHCRGLLRERRRVESIDARLGRAA
ncbi:hypothetical protein [Methylorubrum extorquens]|uniref:Uncharacterized protein n=1 Tax=Methylorubrum extorquens TaxID=408 RepID=A0AAX3WPT2_METEX|nr:hypothetical protein [Methylorubrum extorquens]WHQ72565.1 hypothetical protein KEC54_13925 [Methylorubrum extorquens]